MKIPAWYIDEKQPDLQMNMHTALRKAFDDKLTALLYLAFDKDCDDETGYQYEITKRFRYYLSDIETVSVKTCRARKWSERKFLQETFKQTINDVCDYWSIFNTQKVEERLITEKERIENWGWKKEWNKKVLYMLWQAFCEDTENVETLIEFMFPSDTFEDEGKK